MKNIDVDVIIETAASLADSNGYRNLALKDIAKELNIKSPSLYNHIKNLEDVKERLMTYGWKQVENVALEAAIGVSGYEAIKRMGQAVFTYGLKHEGLIQGMFEQMSEKGLKESKSRDRIVNFIVQSLGASHIRKEDAYNASLMLFGLVSGYCLRALSDDDTREVLEKQFLQAMDIFLIGLKSQENPDILVEESGSSRSGKKFIF